MKSTFVHFTDKQIDNQIGIIEQDSIKAFWSDGQFSMHDMLLFLLKITGPCKVWLSTFSISEVAIRAMNSAVMDSSITELNCLFDYTIKSNKTQLLFFASNVCTSIKLTPNHSKLILLENDHWKLVVVGSANMTPNPRKEAGVIITISDIYDYYKQHLLDTMEVAQNVEFNV